MNFHKKNLQKHSQIEKNLLTQKKDCAIMNDGVKIQNMALQMQVTMKELSFANEFLLRKVSRK